AVLADHHHLLSGRHGGLNRDRAPRVHAVPRRANAAIHDRIDVARDRTDLTEDIQASLREIRTVGIAIAMKLLSTHDECPREPPSFVGRRGYRTIGGRVVVS